MNWAQVWKHQLRWARTIRVCQPLPYFFSVLANATVWPLLWLLLKPSLTVMSGYRFVLRAAKVGIPVAIVNVGPTRGDAKADVRVDAPLGVVLPELAARLTAA